LDPARTEEGGNPGLIDLFPSGNERHEGNHFNRRDPMDAAQPSRNSEEHTSTRERDENRVAAYRAKRMECGRLADAFDSGA
jgi:hypothetical protein